jgi:hypothetical protein
MRILASDIEHYPDSWPDISTPPGPRSDSDVSTVGVAPTLPVATETGIGG